SARPRRAPLDAPARRGAGGRQHTARQPRRAGSLRRPRLPTRAGRSGRPPPRAAPVRQRVAAAIVLGLVSLGAASAPGGPAGQNQNPPVGAPPAPGGALSLVTESACVRGTENFALCVRVDGWSDQPQVDLGVPAY